MKICSVFLVVAIFLMNLFQSLWSMERERVPSSHKSSDGSMSPRSNSYSSSPRTQSLIFPVKIPRGTSNESLASLSRQSSSESSLGSHPHKKNNPKQLYTGSDSSSSKSPRISKKLHRGPQHILWIFGSDGIPMLRTEIGLCGEPCLESLMNTLRLYNVKFFFWITAEDINFLDKDCQKLLSAGLENLKTMEAYPYPETNDSFCQLMGQCQKELENGTIVLYGINNNNKVYEVLAYWSVHIMIEHAMKRDDSFIINGEQCKMSAILASGKEIDQLAYQILQLVYKRILPNAGTPNQYLSDEQITTILVHCLMILTDKSKPFQKLFI